MIKYFEENKLGVDYVVGDIHAAFHKLQAQLHSMGFNPEVDRLFSVGDLVDRGHDHDVLDVWLDTPWFHPVMGNHEQMIVRGMRDSSLMNGGLWFYELPDVDQERLLFKMSQMPLGIEVATAEGPVGIVHADPCTDDWNEFKRNPHPIDVVWSRMRIQFKDVEPVQNVLRVYVGHTPTEPLMLGNVIFLDNAAWRYADVPFNIQRLA